MRIQLIIFGEKKEPERKQYSGAWCLEKMIADLLEVYYGNRIKTKVMDLLRERLEKVGEIK